MASSFGGMRRVPFLPKEFGRAQEQPRAHFPAHDVGPLIDENRQIAIRLHPFGVHGADDGFAGRAHHQRFFERAGRNQSAFGADLKAMMRDDRAFFGEAFDVRRFFFQKAQRNEQRKIGVLMPGVFEHPVERLLDVLPNRVAPGLDDHAAAHGERPRPGRQRAPPADTIRDNLPRAWG